MIDNARASCPERLFWTLFAAGLALSVFMALRCQIQGDQINQLLLGWRLVALSDLQPYGVPTSAGGYTPGGLFALVTALPLWLWLDYRAVALSIVVLNAVAFVALHQAVRPALGCEGRWLLLLLLWFSPWRLYYSCHIWSVNYMIPLGMLHLATALAMRRRRAGCMTFAHALLIGLGAQLHSSAAILAFLSIILFAVGAIRVHWPALAGAVAVTLATLVPWFHAVAADPSILPSGEGFLFRGLVLVFPLLRGLLYWLKMGSLSVPTRVLHFDFTALSGGSADRILGPAAALLGALAHLSVIVSMWANGRLARWARRVRPWRRSMPDRRRPWLQTYVLAGLGAACMAFAMAPTTVMCWQALVVLHIASLMTALTVEALLHTRRRRGVVKGVRAWIALTALLLGALAVASPMYRKGGRRAVTTTLSSDHPMLHDLGIDRHAWVTVDPDAGWTPRMWSLEHEQAR